MTALLQAVTRTAKRRVRAEADFRSALEAARKAHSWGELAQAAGLSRTGVRYLLGHNPREGKR